MLLINSVQHGSLRQFRNFVTFLILAWKIFYYVECNPVANEPLRRSCGAELSRRIASVCHELGGYNSPATSVHYRVKRRVVDECCKNLCSDSDISLYCLNRSDKMMSVPEKKSFRSNNATETVQENQSEKSPAVVARFGKQNSLEKTSQLMFTIPTVITASDNKRSKVEMLQIYPPIRIGTVAPEYKKVAINPPLARMHLYPFH